MVKTFKYRLYPNHKQRQVLEQTLEVCRELYNDALHERKDAWKSCRHSVTYYEQQNQLPACKDVDPRLRSVYAQVLQDVLRRVDKTYKAFFRRKHGFPRFRGKGRYDSFTYPQSGFTVSGTQLGLSKIGNLKIKLHRPIEGEIKTLTLKQENGRWYAGFSCVVEAKPLPVCDEAVGIDVGLESFATTSDGEVIDNPRWFQKMQARLRRAQRRVARRKQGSNRRRKAVRLLANIHKKIFNQRNDFQHKHTHDIVQTYGTIFVEELNTKGLAGGMLAKPIQDAAWAAFITKLAYKAESAGRRLMKVDPRGTSQQCPCGNPVPKSLSDRAHSCDVCGLKTTRDHASALEILRRGLRLQAPSTVCSPVFA